MEYRKFDTVGQLRQDAVPGTDSGDGELLGDVGLQRATSP